MPYVIATTDPQHVCLSTPERCGVEPIVTRRAVATLDEAQVAARKAVYAAKETMPAEMRTQTSLGYTTPATWISQELGACNDIPESGGTIGPLPDGTVIEVERVDGGELAARVPVNDPRVLGDPSYRSACEAYERHSRGLDLANPALMDGRHTARSAELIDAMICAAYNAAQEAGR